MTVEAVTNVSREQFDAALARVGKIYGHADRHDEPCGCRSVTLAALGLDEVPPKSPEPWKHENACVVRDGPWVLVKVSGWVSPLTPCEAEAMANALREHAAWVRSQA